MTGYELDESDKQILLQCGCGWYHSVQIYRDLDWDDTTWITHLEQPKTFLQRIACAWRALFTNETIITGEMMVKSEDLSRLAKYFAKQAKATKNAAATSSNSGPKSVE